MSKIAIIDFGLLVVLIAIGKSSNCTALRATAEKVGLAMEIGKIVTKAASVARSVAGSTGSVADLVVNSVDYPAPKTRWFSWSNPWSLGKVDNHKKGGALCGRRNGSCDRTSEQEDD